MNHEGMSFSAVLSNHRSAVVKIWSEHLLKTYPEPTARFLSQDKDPFRNPVGHTLHEGLAVLFDGLIQQTDVASLAPVLDSIVRIRAVQDFAPGQAVAFPFLLKPIIRAELAANVQRHADELAALEARIDELALLAFDLYAKCREQLYEVKVNEIKRRAFTLGRAHAKGQPSS